MKTPLICFCVAWLLGACQPNAPPAIPSDTPSTVVATMPPSETRMPTIAPSTTTTGLINLVVWMNDEFSRAPAANGGQSLTTIITGFQATYPNIHVSLQPKKPSGKGGIADLLTTTQSVLPQALPDVITLDMLELPRLARDGLLQPFDGRFAPALQNDLYPFARQTGQVDGRVFAIPFTTDLLQLVYDSSQLKTPPLTWTELISSSAKYAVALGDEDGLVSDSFLAQYIALGGHFADARGKPTLDRAPLRDALEFYRNAVAQSVIISNTLSLKTLDDAWRLFTTRRLALADASTHQFLRERNQLKNPGYAAIPTRDGNLTTLSRSWGYAIVTKDAARYAAAERFIEWMLMAENNALWNRAVNRLPVRKGALSLWSNDSAYRDFANQLLSVAVNRPAILRDNTLDVALQTALNDVLTKSVSPADAADKAMAALTR